MGATRVMDPNEATWSMPPAGMPTNHPTRPHGLGRAWFPLAPAASDAPAAEVALQPGARSHQYELIRLLEAGGEGRVRASESEAGGGDRRGRASDSGPAASDAKVNVRLVIISKVLP